MAIPTHKQIMLPLLKLYVDGEVHHRSDFIEKISDFFNLTADERNERVSSGWTRISDRVDWAITYLKSANLLESVKRGYTRITERGKSLLKTQIEYLDENVLKEMYPDVMETAFWNPKLRENSNNESEESIQSDFTPDEQLANIIEQKKSKIYSEIQDQLQKISPKAFEKLVVKLLVAMGYGTQEFSQVTQYSNDGGIDGIIQADQLGFRKIYVQAKRYLNNNVGREDLQKFVGAMMQVSEGIFITTSKFNNNVIEYLKNVPQKQIILIDGDELVKLMYKFNQGVSIKETVEFKGIDGDYFDELES